MDDQQYFRELEDSINKILRSRSPKKIIVAGPGTGKTTFFKRAISYYSGRKNDYLALTFINNLEEELHRELGDTSKIYTFHGYCHYMLRRYQDLRLGLEDNFEYYPPLVKLVKSDWEILNDGESPNFVADMRTVNEGQALNFYLSRGDYYNAVGYDDSVYRVFKSLSEGKSLQDKYKLVIVDEYQDFNKLETSVLSYISDYSPPLIVGDDDQALYCPLRDSNPEFIRSLFSAGDFEPFELPFCLRCPMPVIENFKSLVNTATKNGLLGNRLKKRFDFFPPVKGEDSKIYPKIKLIVSTIQKKIPIAANYLGKYLVQEIGKIPKGEIKQSCEKEFPTVLIIGPSHYLKSILPALEASGLNYEFKEESPKLEVTLDKGLLFLKGDNRHSLGWRIILEAEKPENYADAIKQSTSERKALFDVIPDKYKQDILERAAKYESEPEKEVEKPEVDKNKPRIKLATYEGAKGLSAQHVFILGLQNYNLPKNPDNINDIELCKFLVGLTRTRKQCHILCTTNFAGRPVEISRFIEWLSRDYIQTIKINRDYWN